MWNYIIKYFKDEKDMENQSYINCLFNKGRILTKLFVNDKQKMREQLIEAMRSYEDIKETIINIKKNQQVIDQSLEEQLKVTSEFLELLPFRLKNLDK